MDCCICRVGEYESGKESVYSFASPNSSLFLVGRYLEHVWREVCRMSFLYVMGTDGACPHSNWIRSDRIDS